MRAGLARQGFRTAPGPKGSTAKEITLGAARSPAFISLPITVTRKPIRADSAPMAFSTQRHAQARVTFAHPPACSAAYSSGSPAGRDLSGDSPDCDDQLEWNHVRGAYSPIDGGRSAGRAFSVA